jgi:chemotaxis protein MotB
MKKLTGLAIVGIFVFSITLSGCGKLGKKDFEAWREPYVAQNEQEHQQLRSSLSEISGKVDAQAQSLRTEITTAKEEAIAASEQGDADTITKVQNFAKEEDNKLRQELTQTANTAGEKAQQFAKNQDDDLRKLISQLENQSKTQAQTLSQVEKTLAQAEAEVTKAMSVAEMKPMRAGTARFASGRATLDDAAKQELDKAITMVKTYPDAVVIVEGHADGTPVLSGRFRSNWDLSQARADAAVKYLKEQGVTNTIVTRAKGHTEPIADVKTSEGRAQNRRVEVIIVPAGMMY